MCSRNADVRDAPLFLRARSSCWLPGAVACRAPDAGLPYSAQEGVQATMRPFAPVSRDLDVEVHPEADVVLGIAPCAGLWVARDRLASASFRRPRIWLSLNVGFRITEPEPGAGRVSIHGGAYAEMSHLPFTRAVAGHPQGDRAAVGGHANQYWPVRLGGY